MAKKQTSQQRARKKVVAKRPTTTPSKKKNTKKKPAKKKKPASKRPTKKPPAKKKPARKKPPAKKKKPAKKKPARKKPARKKPAQKQRGKQAPRTKKPAKRTPRKKVGRKAARKAAPTKKPTVTTAAVFAADNGLPEQPSVTRPAGQHRGGELDQRAIGATDRDPSSPQPTVAPAPASPPAANPATPPAAAPAASSASRATGADGTPVIFLAFANDRDDTIGYLRNLPDEARRLRDVLQPAEQAGLCEVVVRSNSTAADIFKVFQDPRYRNRIAILHYGGHANGYQLLLESAAGQAAAADAGGLAKFLGQQQGLHLVFLNGCSTQQQTQGLLEANIAAVISTSRAIEDQVATDFSHQFYQGLAGGASIRTAYTEAEASVQTAVGGDTRGLYFGAKDDSTGQLEADRWPWNLYLRAGSEAADQWNLPEAVNDPLFGLPSLPEQDLPEKPFRHLNWFTRKDAEVFFGRGHQIRELYDRLTAPRTAPILLFYGQSGVGKSSILDAGLIPRLEQEYEVRYLRRGAAGLLDTLQLAFLPEGSGVPVSSAWRVKEEAFGKPLIVFLDQVEELYTRPIAELENELDDFLQVIKATFVDADVRPRGKLVLGFRKEWLAELEAELAARELSRTKVFLEPLDRRGVVEIVYGAAKSNRLREHYGLVVEEGLGELIADDLLADHDSAIAPTLQILLTKMWVKATEADYEHPQFTQDLYQHLRRDGILLRDFLNQQIAVFRQQYPEAVDSGLLLDIVALHTTPLGTADQQSVEQLQQQYSHLGTLLPKLLQQCQDLHLLTIATSTRKESAKTTRLAHDTLAPLVRERFEVSDKPGQRARRILDNRSVDWEDDRQGTPLDEADLAIVELGASGTHALTPTEQRLLVASRQLRAKLQRTRKIIRVAGATAVTVIAILGAWGWWQRSQAEANYQHAESARLELDVKNEDLKKTNIELDAKRKEAIEALAEADTNRGLARELMSDLVPEVTAATEFATAEKTELANASRFYFEQFVERNSKNGFPNDKSLAVLADAKYVIGRIYRESKTFEDAIRSYEEACGWQCHKLSTTRDTLSEVQVDEQNAGLVNDLGYTLNELGHAYRLQGQAQRNTSLDQARSNWKTAKACYLDSSALRQKLVEFEPANSDYHLLYASSLMNIGLADKNLTQNKTALEQFNKADEICEKISRQSASQAKVYLDWHHVAALAKHNKALLIQKDRNRLAEAEQLEARAIEYYQKLPKDDLDLRAELAKVHQNRGVLLYLLKDHGKSIGEFANAAEVLKELLRKRSWVPAYQAQQIGLFRRWQQVVNVGLKGVKDTTQPEDLVALANYGAWSLQYAESYQGISTPDAETAHLKDQIAWWRTRSQGQTSGADQQRIAQEFLASFSLLHARALIRAGQAEDAELARQEAVDLWNELLESANSADRADLVARLAEAEDLIIPSAAPLAPPQE